MDNPLYEKNNKNSLKKPKINSFLKTLMSIFMYYIVVQTLTLHP